MTTLGVAINAMTLFRLQLILQALQLSILVVLSFLLIKAYGVNGAVYALISARSFGILVSAVILYKNR
jgi:Na+-driven multidrug efflux pump